MTTQQIIGLIAILMVVVIALAWSRGRGPRVTQITRTKTSEHDDQERPR